MRRTSLSFKAARKVSDQVILRSGSRHASLGPVALACRIRAGHHHSSPSCRWRRGDGLAFFGIVAFSGGKPVSTFPENALSERGRSGGPDLALEGSERRQHSLSTGGPARSGRGAAA